MAVYLSGQIFKCALGVLIYVWFMDGELLMISELRAFRYLSNAFRSLTLRVSMCSNCIFYEFYLSKESIPKNIYTYNLNV